jgi:hypothetical protein
MQRDIAALTAQVTTLAQSQLLFNQQRYPNGPQSFPGPFLPPHQSFGPNMQLPHGMFPQQQFPLAVQPDVSGPPHFDSVPPNALPYNEHRVKFADMMGVNSPSMMHTARPRSGMRGAPDLAPEDIGNVQKFNDFLKQHSQYAATARDQGQTWSTVAGLLSRYAEDLAIAFTACAMKRGDNTQYTTEQVLNLSDDMFEKLYVESCFPSVEYPSQVIENLESCPFRRQAPDESSPLHAVIRAAEAFRVRLRLLPTSALNECTEEGIMIAFFRLLFGDEAKRRRLDFQQCNSWEEARTALIRRATNQPTWFGDSLRDPQPQDPAIQSRKLPLVSASPTASTHSSGDSTSKPPSYYERRVQQLLKEGALDGMDINGLTPKKICKLATKARFKAKLREDAAATAIPETAKLLQEVLTKQQDQLTAALSAQATEHTKALQALQHSLLRAHTQQHSRDNSRDRGPYRARSQDVYSRDSRDSRDPHEDRPARDFPTAGYRRHEGFSPDSRSSAPQLRTDSTQNQHSPSYRRGSSPRPPSVDTSRTSGSSVPVERTK